METATSCSSAFRTRIPLVVVPRRARAIVVPPGRGGGPAYSGAGPVDLVCGACSALLCSGVAHGMFNALAFACQCGAVNAMP
jgi:hypothetical protein